MESYALLTALETALRPHVESLGGVLVIQGHEADAVALLSTGVDKWRVCLLCDEEDVPEEDGLHGAGVVTFTIRALIQHQSGPLQMEKGADVYKAGGSAHNEPLLKRCTQFRLLLLRTQFMRRKAGEGPDLEPAGDADHETGWKYRGRKPWLPAREFLALRTYQLTFTLRAGLLTPDYGTAADPMIQAELTGE